MTGMIQTDRTFTSNHQQCLRQLADCMIPAGEGLPSAGDEIIFADMLQQLVVHRDVVVRGLDALAGISLERSGKEFTALQADEQMNVVQQMRSIDPVFLQTFESAVAICYYRDDRVLESLGLPAGAPFPQGRAVTPTDWTLLDPVRERRPFYRVVDAEHGLEQAP